MKISKKNITVQEELELFDKGLVIRRAWIRPPGKWEYYTVKIGHSESIAITSYPRAAYNAGVRWVTHQEKKP